MKLYSLLRILLLVTLIAGLNFAVPAQPAYAASFVVNTLSDEIDGSCVDGDCSLRDAIELAAPGDTITFSVTGTITLTHPAGALYINKDLTITGPGSSLLTVDGNHTSRIFVISQSSSPTPNYNVNISGMTMTNGYADPTSTCSGGAIFNDALLTMDDVVITGNNAPVVGGNPNYCGFSRGGGIFVFSGRGSLTITNSTISNNSTYWDGGGIYFQSAEGTVSLTNVIIDNNQSTGSGAGGISVDSASGTIILNQVTISNNTTSTSGSNAGGLYIGNNILNPSSGFLTAIITDSVFSLNSANEGGGIYSNHATLNISNSTFSSNTARDDGGAIFLSNSTTSIESSTFEENHAGVTSTSDGGAIVNLGATDGVNPGTGILTVTNSTFTGNTAGGVGGAIKNMASGGASNTATTTIRNSTIVENTVINAVGGLGGGIFAGTASAVETSNVILSNSIVYGNTITTGSDHKNCDEQNGATIVANNSNIFQNMVNDCPLLGIKDIISSAATSTIVNTLGSNGGLTQTMSLPVGSPAIDAGDVAICTAAPVSNASQNGFARSQGGHCDIGAYELDNIPPHVQSVTLASPNPTSAPSVDFTVTFSEPVTGVDIGDFTLTKSGVSGAAVSGISGTGSVYTVTVSTGTSSGSIRLDVLLDNSIKDLSLNPLEASFSSGETYTVVVNPAVKTITRANINPTNLASVDFTVTFSEPVTGVDVSDFTLTTSGVSGPAVSGISGTGSVYTVTVSTGTGSGTLRLDVLNDGSIKNITDDPMLAGFTGGEIYKVRTTTFTDVPLPYWAWQYVERLYGAGVTGGCVLAPLQYCPDSTVTRAQMAVFLLKGMHGSGFNPPAINGVTGFTDVPTNYWAAAWIKQLAAEGITSGCGAGVYCPEATVTRAQMAVFLLKAKHGSSYTPPAATGIFSDVPLGYWADKWIERLAAEGVTSGCGAGIYCPDADVTRAQMAVFLVKAFGLP